MSAALKDKKALATIMKQNLRFKQLRLNYLNNQKKKRKKEKKEHLRLVITSIKGRCGFKCTRTIDCRLASAFLKNLKTFHNLSVTLSPVVI